MRQLLACVLLVAACCIPTSAHARPRRDPDVTLQLQLLQPGSVASVEREVRGAAPVLLLRCDNFCSAQLPRGRYQLRLESPDRRPPDVTSIRLDHSTLFTSRPPQPAAALLGASMIGVGAVAAITGVVSLAYSLMSGMCHGYMCGASPKFLWYGVVATPAGALLAIGGLLLFLNARRLFDRVGISAAR